MEISKCYKSGLLSPRELVVEHLSAWVWPSSPRTRKLGVSAKPASVFDLSSAEPRQEISICHQRQVESSGWGVSGALMGEHFHLEFLWEWAAGSATLNHSILRIQTFPSMSAKRSLCSEA